MPQIRPITDLRDTTMISELCHKSGEPVYITKNGYGDLVVMSMDTYERMLEERSTDTATAAAEAEYAHNGEAHDAKQALAALRRKHFE